MKKLASSVLLSLSILAIVGLSTQSSQGAEESASMDPFIYYVNGTVIDIYGSDCWYVEDCSTGTRHYFDVTQLPTWVTIYPGYSYYVEFHAAPNSCSNYRIASVSSPQIGGGC